MTSKLKCPFCQQELIREGMNHWWCSCNINHQGKELYGTTALWQALIQSQRDLQTAVQALKDIQTAQGRHWGATDTDIKTDCKYYARKALEQIEHKE